MSTFRLEFTGVSLYLWGITFCLFIVSGIYFIYRGSHRDDKKEKYLMYGFGSLFLGFSGGRLLLFLKEINLTGFYAGHAYYAYFATEDIPLLSQICNVSGLAAFVLGFTFFLLACEMTFLPTKYLLTVVNIGLTLVAIFVPYALSLNIMSIVAAVDITLFLLIFFTLLKKSSSEFQPIVIFIIIGSFIVLIGHLLDTTIFGYALKIPQPVIPLLHIIGVLVTISPMAISSKFFSRALYASLLSMIFLVCLICFLLVIFAQTEIFYELGGIYPIIAWSSIIFITIVIAYVSVRIIMVVKNKSSQIKGQDQADFIKVYGKSQRVTEEEISVSKEKQICLVCKGEIRRENYICPECKAFYCQRCSNALKDLENACWSCNAPFDPSKPIKHEKVEGLLERQGKNGLELNFKSA
ncbi:MAG: hypothetical protein ACFFCS_14630 [Candidatus Hodarchaeota archaeon]